jgi:histidinol dehydrogenase
VTTINTIKTIRILDLETARNTILSRRRASDPYPPALLHALERRFGAPTTPEQAVTRIVEDIRVGGDSALARWTVELDGVDLIDPRVTVAALGQALDEVPGRLRGALDRAIERVREFHRRQPVASWTTAELGGTLGQRVTPIRRVGVYVPGGSAPLPSSLIMAAVPARVAGVGEIVVCTPPRPHPTILAAARLCEVDEVYQVGGAQAIAAMAHGTETIAPVDKIVGAGNLFVTLAKRQVYGLVGIDGLAGPTETLIIADETAAPAWAAADLLAQAEHDVLATAILLTPAGPVAHAVQREVERRLAHIGRREQVESSLTRQSGIVVTPDLETAVELANAFAPEHLCLSVADAWRWAERLTNAGGIFVGERSFEVLGDYVAGPSHIMPTGGTARFASPLNVLDFVKLSSIIALDAETSAALSPLAAEIARAESLTSHAEAAELRCNTRRRGADVV